MLQHRLEGCEPSLLGSVIPFVVSSPGESYTESNARGNLLDAAHLPCAPYQKVALKAMLLHSFLTMGCCKEEQVGFHYRGSA